MEKFQEITALDEKLFLFLNGLHAPFLDPIMSWITGSMSWIPLYMVIILFIALKFPKKQAIITVVYIIVAVGLADFVTSGLMKPFFERLRPCHNEAFSNLIHLVTGCGGQYGFASSHAANSFALAGSLVLILKKYPIITFVMLLWAILVSYSRIYVGVHYPSDVIVGGLVGLFISFLLFKILSITLIKFKQV